MKEKVILAYSGGLDTTVLIPWLKENYDYEVICVCIDVGQGNELDGLEERAKYCGASKLYIEHATDEFCDEYIAPCLMANATYENNYLHGPALNGENPGGYREEGRRCRHLPRRDWKRQRSGALRVRHQGSGSGYEDHRSLADLEHPVP